MYERIMKAAAEMVRPLYNLEKFVFRCTGYELPLLRRVWDRHGRKLQNALNWEHGTGTQYRAGARG